ncbi:hypothetical protein Desti_4693 [Desulfomonile tiedjei DSM 6799]|uniref:Uncharacterized protein n=1 Tax=Desulfomonile tiedjei (strain ATCC 49306 / DSM 6799 / DCB-1) TaxID=706587 RepID=I4CCM3_DESTA|nr:hypothetical protein Desti_4693 [Desulfomonile tiedjei DSM 6799]
MDLEIIAFWSTLSGSLNHTHGLGAVHGLTPVASIEPPFQGAELPNARSKLNDYELEKSFKNRAQL